MIFLPNWVGDQVMATAALRAFREYWGAGTTIYGVARPNLKEVLAGSPELDHWIFAPPDLRGAWSTVRALRSAAPDLAVLFPNSLRTALIAMASGIPWRVGYARGGRGLLLTHKLAEPRQSGRRIPTPAVDSYLALASAIGAPAGDKRLALATTAEDEAAADALWKQLHLSRQSKVILLNNTGASTSAKLWPVERMAQLARRLAVEQGATVLLLGGPKEIEASAKTEKLANHPAVISVNRIKPLSLGLTKALVRRSNLLVSTDSGPRFFAPAFGVPLVSLVGPFAPEWSRTYFDRERVLFEPLGCRSCPAGICPSGSAGCVHQLAIDQVFEAVKEMLAGGAR